MEMFNMDDIMGLLNWFLDNVGTLGMFIISVFLLIETKKTVKQGEINIKERQKPEVIAYCDSVTDNAFNNIFFIIKNVGSSPARNLKTNVEVMSGNVSSSRLLKAYVLNNSIATFAHDQMVKGYVGNLSSLKDKDGKYPIFKVSLSYEDGNRGIYSESYILDVNMFKDLVYLGNKKGIPELVKEVAEIKNVIKASMREGVRD